MLAVDGVLRVVVPMSYRIDDSFIDCNRWKFWMFGETAVRLPVLQSLEE
jgi:hypothetical protein